MKTIHTEGGLNIVRGLVIVDDRDMLLVRDTSQQTMKFYRLLGRIIENDASPVCQLRKTIHKQTGVKLAEPVVYTTKPLQDAMRGCTNLMHLCIWRVSSQQIGDLRKKFAHGKYIVRRTSPKDVRKPKIRLRPSDKNCLQMLAPDFYRAIYGE